MDPGPTSRSVLFGFLLLVSLILHVSGNLVFPVSHKFQGRRGQWSLSELKAHDIRRHGRNLLSVSSSAVDLELGGNGHPSETGLYFAKLGIGSPSKDYYVQVDTGSDILWVNCIECANCPKKSDIGVKLTLYDPKDSSTSQSITCDQDFCTSQYDGQLPGCKPELLCQYNVVYGDGSSTAGYFVKDVIEFDKVSGSHQTSVTNGSIVFGCGAKQSGQLGKSSEALDGILGFGQANSSMISQLAAAGKVKKQFAHCLDNVNGGGIFAIGEVVETKLKLNMTPLVAKSAHYNVVMEAIEVGGDVVDLPSDTFDNGDKEGTIIDSGTTLAYLPQVVFEPVMKMILSKQPLLKLHTVEDQFTCFQYSENVDDGFPVVTFHFKNSVSLSVYPHEYLFQLKEYVWCSGWQSSGMKTKDGGSMTLLGDLVLSNKLVFYDLENQSIGWIDYNCSSSIKVRDDSSGAIYYVDAHNISSASGILIGRRLLTFLLFVICMLLQISI
ncbi:putative nepenthesin [Rosa chinensis]|uniref:Putative nepenthesin n=1 Tax=Rosa chinensis TaxID=74649 RepID=A0A2P6PW93_ROSCH|nr:aspartic proteinase 36 [Rosa chinensis]PRQ26176.1 putative nepenthesin [Rosa chinensis]